MELVIPTATAGMAAPGNKASALLRAATVISSSDFQTAGHGTPKETDTNLNAL